MATYAVGDVHGCYETLERLLERSGIDLDRDALWLVGDLVNRGPRSLEVLRWARRTSGAMGERFVAVLGNHDLHLLARAAGVAEAKPRDTLEDVLEAPDRRPLLEWLRRRPFLHGEGEILLVHAGLLPEWDGAAAAAAARAAAAALVSAEGAAAVLERPAPQELAGAGVRRTVAAFTRMRCLDAGGGFCAHAGPPEEAPAGCTAWFAVTASKWRGLTVVAGHWAALGLELREDFLGLDAGVAWGGPLVAVRLEDRRVFEQPRLDP